MQVPHPPIRAAEVADFYRGLEPSPLTSDDDLDAFYEDGLNRARGLGVTRIERDLRRAHGGRHFRAFLAGHSGCGKTTELARLARSVKDQFRVVRFSAKEEMHPASAKAFDIPIVMMIKLARRIAAKEEDGGLGWSPPDQLAQRVLEWFHTETVTAKTGSHTGGGAKAGVGADGDSWWAKAFGMFARVEGEVKFSSERQTEVIERRTARLPELISLLNEFLDACNEELRRRHGQEWLIVGEDFEKLLDARLPEQFFVRESAVFAPLRTHVIFTIPVDLAWSGNRGDLPFAAYSIQDTPVYTADFQPDPGRKVLRGLLDRRIDTSRFEAGQLERLIVASGGHLRDLFYLVREAADLALDADPAASRIGEQHVNGAIAGVRRDVILRLGESPYDPVAIPWEKLAVRLVTIHERGDGPDLLDPALHLLVRKRAVQQFNGKGRFAVAPLVVDILINQKVLPAGAPGGLI